MPVAILEASGGAALDTIQTINSAISINGTAWGSTIPTTFTAAGQTLTLPTIAIADIGKSITVQNAGSNSFTLAIASGVITSAIGGVSLTTAIANVQIDTKSDGTATFFIVGKITDSNEVDQFKNYLNNL